MKSISQFGGVIFCLLIINANNYLAHIQSERCVHLSHVNIYIFAPEIPSIEKERKKERAQQNVYLFTCAIPSLSFDKENERKREKEQQQKKHTTQVDGLEKGK